MAVAVWLLRPLLILAFGVGDVYLYRALETRADQLGVGCLLAVVVRTVQWRAFFERMASRVWLVLALLAGLLASLTLFRGTLLFQYGLGYTLEPVLVGQISYGMYLFHPVLMDPPRHFFCVSCRGQHRWRLFFQSAWCLLSVLFVPVF